MPEEEHPIPRLAREARETTSAVAEFFNPVEKHFGPHEDGDWPRDLTRDELGGLMPQLRETIQNLAYAIELVLDQENLDANDADVGQAVRVAVGLRLVVEGAEVIRAGEGLFGTKPGQTAARPQQALAAQNVPPRTRRRPAPGRRTRTASRPKPAQRCPPAARAERAAPQEAAVSRAIGPRPPLASGNAALAWALISPCGAWPPWRGWPGPPPGSPPPWPARRIPPFGARWVLALLHGRAAQAWPGVPTPLVAAACAVLAAVLGARRARCVAGRRAARDPPRRPGRRAQPGPGRPPASRNPRRREGRAAAALAGRHPARPPGRGRHRAAARPAQDAGRGRPGPVRLLGRHGARVLRAARRQDHLARRALRAVGARPGRGHQRQGRPVGGDRRAARRVRLADLDVRPAGGHRRRAAVLGGHAGRAEQRRSGQPDGRALRR